MLYTKNLEEIIFNRHLMFNTDEFIVISGYVGPTPIKKLDNLPLNSKVIYGMYGSEKIKPTLHNSLLSIQNTHNSINIYYSLIPVHSKCYIWRNKGEIIHALIGSANFSVNGLNTPFREVLAETTYDTFEQLSDYINHIFHNSISCLELERRDVYDDVRDNFDLECSLSLLDKNNEVQDKAGLNWGQNPNNHTKPNDAYIAIRVKHIKDFPNIFPPKQINPFEENKGGRAQRHNDTIEIIWDDGVTMEGLLEGSQPIEGVVFPKQISSFPSKSQLGEYIRNRIGVPLGQPVQRHHLERYGRTDINVKLINEGIYQFDFSVPF